MFSVWLLPQRQKAIQLANRGIMVASPCPFCGRYNLAWSCFVFSTLSNKQCSKTWLERRRHVIAYLNFAPTKFNIIKFCRDFITHLWRWKRNQCEPTKFSGHISDEGAVDRVENGKKRGKIFDGCVRRELSHKYCAWVVRICRCVQAKMNCSSI